jgi:hypothetical protein
MRNGRMVALIVTATVVCGAGWLRAQPRDERATIIGEVVDMWCYLEVAGTEAAKKACATACAKAGNPMAILDAKGELYSTSQQV